MFLTATHMRVDNYNSSPLERVWNMFDSLLKGTVALNLEIVEDFNYLFLLVTFTKPVKGFELATFQSRVRAPLTWLLPPSPGEPLPALGAVLPGAVGQRQQFNSYFKREMTGRQKVDFIPIYSEIFCIHGVCFYWPPSPALSNGAPVRCEKTILIWR